MCQIFRPYSVRASALLKCRNTHKVSVNSRPYCVRASALLIAANGDTKAAECVSLIAQMKDGDKILGHAVCALDAYS